MVTSVLVGLFWFAMFCVYVDECLDGPFSRWVNTITLRVWIEQEMMLRDFMAKNGVEDLRYR